MKKGTIFNSVMVQKPRRNVFDLSQEKKLSCNMGELIPCFLEEVVPGDTFNVVSQQLLRVAPLVAPIMHQVDCYIHYFFVPNRLVWSGWEDFVVGGVNGNPPPAAPYVNIGNTMQLQVGMNGDYLGYPTGDLTADNIKVSPIPIAGLNLIWNEYYRDQNLQETEKEYRLSDGLQTSPQFLDDLNGRPYKRAWNHDYFTSCLPFAQKGDAVDIPLYGSADINFDSDAGNTWVYDVTTDTKTASTALSSNAAGLLLDNGNNPVLNIDNSEVLSVDLSSATGATINDLRRAIALQQWLELNARGGSRYIEHILVHFGVRSDDARLQRPEYLGGGKSTIQFSEVLQMSESSETPQGNMAGHGISYGQTHRFKYFAKEHGFIFGILSVMPKTAYQQGLPKRFTRFDHLDYFYPKFANIGEQEVKNKEVYANSANPDDVFGYIPRYSEYKYGLNTVHGEFKTSLNYWHLGRIFEDEPRLNEDFIQCDPSTRIFAVTDPSVHHLYIHQFHSVKAIRPMPVYGTPGLASI